MGNTTYVRGTGAGHRSKLNRHPLALACAAAFLLASNVALAQDAAATAE